MSDANDKQGQVPEAELAAPRPEVTEATPPGPVLADRLVKHGKNFVGPLRQDLFAAAARLYETEEPTDE